MTSDSPADRGHTPVLRRRWIRALAALAGLVIVVRAALPFVIVWVVEREGARALGRVVTLDDVDLDLLRGRLRAEMLWASLPLPGEGAPPPEPTERDRVAGFDALDANLSWLALLRGEIRIESLELDVPGLMVDRSRDGTIAPIVLAAPAEAEETPQAQSDPTEGDGTGEGGAWPIRVDRLTLRGAIVRLELQDETTPATVVDFEIAQLGVSDFAFRDGAISLGDIEIDAPRATVRRDLVLAKGDASDPAATAPPHETAPPAVDEDTPAAAPIKLRIQQIRLGGAEFVVETEQASLAIGLELNARDVSLDEPFDLDVALRVGSSGRIALEGRARALPPFYDGTIEWESLPLPGLLAVAQADLPMALETGTAGGQLRVRFGDEDELPEKLEASGSLRLDGIDLREVVGVGDIAFESLSAGLDGAIVPFGSAAGTEPVAIRIGRVDLAKPRVSYVLAEPASDGPGSSDSSAPAAEASPDGARPAAPPASVRLGELHVADGTIAITDRNVDPPYQAEINRLHVDVRDLQLPERSLKSLKISSRGPGPATLAFSGGLVKGNGKFALELYGLGLPKLAPYLRRALGQDVTGGTLTLRTDFDTELPDRIVAENELILHDLRLGKASGGDFEAQLGVSLPVAMLLLRDGKGAITLEPRVVLERGSVAVAPILREALNQALRAALRTPLRTAGLLGNVVTLGLLDGVGGSGGAFAMEPGGTALEPEEVARIAKGVLALADRPELGIEIRGRANHEDDAMLSETALAQLIASGGTVPGLASAADDQRQRVRQALAERAVGEPGPLSPEDEVFVQQLARGVEVGEERRTALATERAEALREQLVEGYALDPARIRLGPARQGGPGVEMELIAIERSPGAVGTEPPPEAP